jgi:hypothetical protein
MASEPGTGNTETGWQTDVVNGAGAGAIGVWAMDVVTWALYRRQPATTVAREKEVRPLGQYPAHVAAAWISRRTGGQAREEPNALGLALHSQLGMIPAMAYSRLRRRFPWLRAGRGALYGLVLFVVNDELGTRALRLAGRARDYPWPAHARGLVGHVVLGVVTDAVLDLFEQRSTTDHG